VSAAVVAVWCWWFLQVLCARCVGSTCRWGQCGSGLCWVQHTVVGERLIRPACMSQLYELGVYLQVCGCGRTDALLGLQSFAGLQRVGLAGSGTCQAVLVSVCTDMRSPSWDDPSHATSLQDSFRVWRSVLGEVATHAAPAPAHCHALGRDCAGPCCLLLEEFAAQLHTLRASCTCQVSACMEGVYCAMIGRQMRGRQ
jgi:hypothetical protein